MEVSPGTSGSCTKTATNASALCPAVAETTTFVIYCPAIAAVNTGVAVSAPVSAGALPDGRDVTVQAKVSARPSGSALGRASGVTGAPVSAAIVPAATAATGGP